ncbi:ubiquinol-cytochrome c reductase core subunit 2 [Cryptococcus bacillisporus CA1873]|uniref:Cytochrome b-c1 complex subunit 2, mitochondrial n=1 Tax=Cryptococcus bacillisporus CA1873 TaxID=1296111 RepID=A0ABR5B7W6_CRYGA|nr:ubiquinol-cytochrome c reductase core subunit 2 [Cryptococcus bacillisporus CA1873]|eukprot:KIR59682.1 ubiquinol-cytochrome c reductase core subunit 2 [Cryptococcus gattii CA1873]
MYSLNRLPRSAALKNSANLLRRNASTTSAGGVNVVGFENKGPAATSSLTVAIKAGSRYETTPGVAHVLKSFAYKATASASALRTAREAELYGGVLSAALTREHLLLSAEFLRGDEEHFLNVLASVLSSSQFYQHELNELVLPVVEAETISAQAIPSTIALDLAHSLAFRRGLGNSLYANKNYPVTIDDVKSFGDAAFAKSNIAVVGTGISTEVLAKAVGNAFGAGTSSASKLSTPQATYYGGETRVPLDIHAPATATPTMVIAFGTSSPASADLKVLKHLLGGETSVKWTPGASPLAQAADKIPGASAKAFLLPYSDAALFGVVLSAPTSAQTKALAQEVASIVKGAGEFKEEEVKRAIAKATFEDAASTETLPGFVAAAGPAALVGSVPKAQSFSGVSASSISKAAAELLKGKPTVVNIGNITVLPYADELGL